MAHRSSSVLREEAAICRRASIDADRGISYTVFYYLEKGDCYHGLVEVKFNYVGSDDIFFDFTGDTIETLVVNGTTIGADVREEMHQEGKVPIQSNWLKTGEENSVTLKFHNRYYRDGEGLHTYIDTDGKQYIYTETEPFLQNRVIPCFDQPDLKGTFKRYVCCPNDWVAITTEAAVSEQSTEQARLTSQAEFVNRIFQDFTGLPNNNKFYEFIKSKPIPTYLNSLFAGAYFRFDLAEDKRLNNLPMSIYCRETLRQFVEHQLDDIFEYHKQSIKFYSDFFIFDYPFSKCDAIFCPEYRMGAMEYPGGITYSESIYLYRTTTPSIAETSNRGRVIFHEMAHMWYGNTVTMKWWDGLWLNESFADFCCFEAWSGTQDNLPFATYDGRLAFLSRKQWGYREDVMITTHPIQHSVVDTLAAESVFDGITYPKGAACIKQLMTVLGEKRFKAAMVDYFKRHAFKNTTLDDLIFCCKEQVKTETHPIFNLDNWNVDHLQKAGLNTVQIEWDPVARGPAKLKIRQGAVLSEHPTLRYHKMGLAFIGAEGQILKEITIIVDNQPVTELTYDGDLAPSAILLNHGDQAFVRVVYDQTSLAFLMNNILKLEKILDRGQVLKYINDHLKFGEIKAKDYFPFLVGFIKAEKNPQLIQFGLTEIGEILRLLPPSNQSNEIFNILIEKLSDPTTLFEGDMLALIFGSLINIASHDEGIHILKQVVDGTSQVHHLKGIKYSLSQHWHIIFLAQTSQKYSPEEKKQLVDDLLAKDNTDSKKEWQLKMQGLLAREAERRQLIETLMDPKDLSYKEVEHLCFGLTHKLVPQEVREDYFDFYFDNFLKMFRSLNASYAKTIRVSFMPSSATQNDFIISKLTHIISQTTESEAALKKGLMMVLDTAQRRKRLFEYNSA